MRVITEDHLRYLAWKGLLTITTQTDKEAFVRWEYGEDEHFLVTQNQ